MTRIEAVIGGMKMARELTLEECKAELAAAKSYVESVKIEHEFQQRQNARLVALLRLYRKPCEAPQARDTEADAILAEIGGAR